MASVTRLFQVVKLKPQAKQCQRLFSASVISKTPERFGTAESPNNTGSGWTWTANGKDRVGMGGKDAGLGTEAKTELGKDKTYKAPEFFGYDNYSFYDIEVGVVGEGKRCPQPDSGLTEYW